MENPGRSRLRQERTEGFRKSAISEMGGPSARVSAGIEGEGEGRSPWDDVTALIAARRRKFSRHLPELPPAVDGEPALPDAIHRTPLDLARGGPAQKVPIEPKRGMQWGGGVDPFRHCPVWEQTAGTTPPCSPNGVRCCADVERVFHPALCASRRRSKRNSTGDWSPVVYLPNRLSNASRLIASVTRLAVGQLVRQGVSTTMDPFVPPLRCYHLFSSSLIRPLLHFLHRHLILLLRGYAQIIIRAFVGRLLSDIHCGAGGCTRITLLVFISSVRSALVCGENCDVCVFKQPWMMCADRWVMVARAIYHHSRTEPRHWLRK